MSTSFTYCSHVIQAYFLLTAWLWASFMAITLVWILGIVLDLGEGKELTQVRNQGLLT